MELRVKLRAEVERKKLLAKKLKTEKLARETQRKLIAKKRKELKDKERAMFANTRWRSGTNDVSPLECPVCKGMGSLESSHGCFYCGA